MQVLIFSKHQFFYASSFLRNLVRMLPSEAARNNITNINDTLQQQIIPIGYSE